MAMFEQIRPVALLGQFDQRLIPQQVHNAATQLQLHLARQRFRNQSLHFRPAVRQLAVLGDDPRATQPLKQDVIPTVRQPFFAQYLTHTDRFVDRSSSVWYIAS